MEIFINKNNTNKEIISFNSGLNYGRFFDNATKNYELRINLSEFIHLIEQEYNQIRDEIKLDDKKYNEQSEFSNSNYCSLKELVNYSEDFESIFKTYLNMHFFQKLFKETSTNQYIINSTDSVEVNLEEVIIRGRVFSK